MKAEEKYLIKQKIKNTKLATFRQTGKKPTKEEIFNTCLDIAKSVKTIKPKPRTEGQAEAIAEVLKNLRGL